MTTARAAEAQRQQALLAALMRRGPASPELQLMGAAPRVLQGLDAYRINAAAIASRALAAVFPTVTALIGADDFEHLAHEFWRVQPPALGDLGEWGGGFPGWLEAHAAFTAWPYFGDCARLDLALHRCERAADAEVDSASLALLAEGDPAQVTLALKPGTALIASNWPIVAIHAAHHGAEGGFAAVDLGVAETAFVVRSAWRATVQRVDAATAGWTTSLLAVASLATALDAAGEGFDLAAWLANALQQQWLKGVEPIGDQSPSPPAGDSP